MKAKYITIHICAAIISFGFTCTLTASDEYGPRAEFEVREKCVLNGPCPVGTIVEVTKAPLVSGVIERTLKATRQLQEQNNNDLDSMHHIIDDQKWREFNLQREFNEGKAKSKKIISIIDSIINFINTKKSSPELQWNNNDLDDLNRQIKVLNNARVDFLKHYRFIRVALPAQQD